jgi:hypothetical protein
VADDAESKSRRESWTSVLPKAVVSVETAGPNRIGVKHSSAGYDIEALEKLPKLEQLFNEASSRRSQR